MTQRDIDVDRLPMPQSPQPGVYTEDPAEEPKTRLDEIIRMLESPSEVDLEQITRLIAIEIAYAMSDAKAAYNPRATQERVKALRELSKTLQEGDSLSKKDFLNFDGPKFRYVFQEWILLLRSALKTAGFHEDDQNHVLRVVRDAWHAREPELRAETVKVTAESLFNTTSAEG